MDFNNFNKISVVFIFLFIIFSVFSTTSDAATDQVAHLQEAGSNLQFTFLEAQIHVTIKNNNNHAEFFKISQQYTGDGTVSVTGTNSSTIDWNVISTSPPAIKMANFINPGGDLGWEIDSGQTREVSFTLVESNPPTPFFIQRGDSSNTFWPIINDPGSTATYFLPNEIEFLNPNLQVVTWSGHFFFFLKNLDSTSPRTEGLIRAPIVPINSVLTASNPTVDFIDTENPTAQTAGWDVTLFPGQTKSYSYTYSYPSGSSVTPVNRQSASTRINSEGSTGDPKTPTTIPTKNTGVPYGLFVVGGIVIAAGIAFARYIR